MTDGLLPLQGLQTDLEVRVGKAVRENRVGEFLDDIARERRMVLEELRGLLDLRVDAAPIARWRDGAR